MRSFCSLHQPIKGLRSIHSYGNVRAKTPIAPVHLQTEATAHFRNVSADVVKTPSNLSGSNLFESLKEHTVVLSDSTLKSDDTPEDAASSSALVNFALLSHILAQSAFYELSNAIEKGVSLAHSQQPGDEAAAQDQALVNVASMLHDGVTGRIVAEVDPRLCNDADAMVRRATSLLGRFEGQGIKKSSLLLQVPATWAGIQAAEALESGEVPCQLNNVYSFAQAVAAVRAKASVVVVNITHVNLWYDRNPNAIRDPQGPRQDAGCSSTVNVGVRIAAAIFAYSQQQGGHTKVVVTGLRRESEVLQLSGIDYMILPAEMQAKMAERGTLQGYNDGLSATDAEDGGCPMPALDAEFVQSYRFLAEEVEEVDEAHFESELGMAGLELLQEKVARDIASAEKVAELLKSVVVARE